MLVKICINGYLNPRSLVEGDKKNFKTHELLLRSQHEKVPYWCLKHNWTSDSRTVSCELYLVLKENASVKCFGVFAVLYAMVRNMCIRKLSFPVVCVQIICKNMYNYYAVKLVTKLML